ncbi:MAG: hypothetical protein COC05_00660, partial [Gammaproteobacteria bacterium]
SVFSLEKCSLGKRFIGLEQNYCWLNSGYFRGDYVAFDIEIPGNTVLTKHAKFGPALRGGRVITTGGNSSTGYNGFSARNAFDVRQFGKKALRHPQGTGGVYLYHTDQNNTTGSFSPARINGVPQQWRLGQITRVQIRVKMNTPERSNNAARKYIQTKFDKFNASKGYAKVPIGNDDRVFNDDQRFRLRFFRRNLPASIVPKDGILQVWHDGKLVLDRRNMRWRYDDAIHIDQFFYSASYGGNDSSFSTVKEEKVWFSDMAVSDKPLFYNPPR